MEPLHTGGIHLGWLETLTMVVCSMKLTPQLPQLHLLHSHFRALPPFFVPSAAADSLCHNRQNKTLPTSQKTAILKPYSLPSVWNRQTQVEHITSCLLMAYRKELNHKSSQGKSTGLEGEGEKKGIAFVVLHH